MCKIIYHPFYSNYNPGQGHPFDPVRVEMVVDLLRELGLLKNIIQPEPVQPEELYAIHSKEYVKKVESLSLGNNDPDAEIIGLGTLDNPIFPGMAEAARYQAGGTLLGAKLLLEDKAKLVLQMGGGFHHAHPSLASGFCIYNDLALAIKQMTDAGWHVAYLDLDVHHCDGVQEIFYSDDKVMTISFHESGEYLFPGTGYIHERGQGMGRSLKLNIPLEPFTEGDSYLEVMNKILEPALSWFKPSALVVQAGADAHFSDPLADLLLTTQDFEKIFRKVVELVKSKCKGRALFTFGGGYSIPAVFRIWTILYNILSNYEIPGNL
ncbi:MAG TPA: acetoin utilization protein AcuC, partial [Ignavibacteriaceae bacterium]|nr:acetoin utilization protein AcuC [Ignavibacteriaceae bacterium]